MKKSSFLNRFLIGDNIVGQTLPEATVQRQTIALVLLCTVVIGQNDTGCLNLRGEWPIDQSFDDPSLQSDDDKMLWRIAITMLAQAGNWMLKTGGAGFVVISKEGIQRW